MALGHLADMTLYDSFSIVKTGDGSDTLPTSFPAGVTSGTIDLLDKNWYGVSGESKSNYLQMIFTGDLAGTGTVEITGAAEGGPEIYMGSLALTFVTTETTPWVWASTIAVTNTHIACSGIKVADSGNSRVSSVGFDAIGYRYIKFYSTALTTTTSMRIYARSL